MHYLDQGTQKSGWAGDFFLFKKKKFFDDFYIINNNNVCNDFENIISNYIVPIKDTSNLFQTRFMTAEAENEIDYNITEGEKNKKVSKTTLIENKFKMFLKNREHNKNPKRILQKNFTRKKEDLMDVVAYFALQSSRTPLNLFGWFAEYIKIYPFKKTKEYALGFSDFYKQQYLCFFKQKYSHFLQNKNDILIIPMELATDNPNLHYLITVCEYNTINLLQYKKFYPSLKKYNDNLLKNIDVTVVGGNLLYFCIIIPKSGFRSLFLYWHNMFVKYKEFPWTIYDFPRSRSFYEPILKDVQETWNAFSLSCAHEYLICSNREEAKKFLSEQLFYLHTNKMLEAQYNINSHINDLLELEKLLK